MEHGQIGSKKVDIGSPLTVTANISPSIACCSLYIWRKWKEWNTYIVGISAVFPRTKTVQIPIYSFSLIIESVSHVCRVDLRIAVRDGSIKSQIGRQPVKIEEAAMAVIVNMVKMTPERRIITKKAFVWLSVADVPTVRLKRLRAATSRTRPSSESWSSSFNSSPFPVYHTEFCRVEV